MTRHLLRPDWLFVLAVGLAACEGSTMLARDDGGSDATAATDAPAASTDGGPRLDARTRIDSGPVGTGDFDERCAGASVLVCVGFDEPSDIAGTFGDNRGILPGDTTPRLDTAEKASGASSLLFTIPSNSGANSSGSYFANFSEDLSVQLEANDAFYVQWRQRFSPDFLATHYDGGGGWKQVILGTGDRPGCSASNATSIGGGGECATSCTTLELVVQNTSQRGFAQMYNSCTGSASHGPYAGFEEPFMRYDFKLQNARPAPYCLYTQGSTGTYFPPEGNCFGYFPDEWMTFQVAVSIGPRVGDEWVDSHVSLSVAREGQPSEPVIDWGPWALSAGDLETNERYGKVWLLPYHTDKSPDQTHPVGYTWYDELIVSTERIPDPE